MREAVFAVLRKTPQTHFRAIENDLRKQVEGYERHDILALNEVLWTLLVQGVLAPGKNSLNPDLPFVHVTEYGARCLESEEILAHDPEGYVRRIEELTEDRDIVDTCRRDRLGIGILGPVRFDTVVADS